MKKTLLPLLALASLLGLAGCGETTGSSASTEPSSSSLPSSSSSSSSSSSEDSDIVSFRLSVSVKGITVDDSQNAVWMGTALGGSTAAWATYKFTESTETVGEWYYDFVNVECASYKYNIYVDNKDSFTWNNINSEGSSASPRTLLVESGAELKVEATFTKQPDSTKTVDITVKITPSGLTLESWTRVWIWDSKTNSSGGTLLNKGDDGVWSVVITAVPVYADFTVTACLGTATAISWSYKSSDCDSMVTAVEVTTSLVEYTATFSGQPTNPDAGHALNVTFFITNFATGWNWPQLVIVKPDGTTDWKMATAQDATDATKFTGSFGGYVDGSYSAHVYLYNAADWTFFANGELDDFTFTVDGADLSLTFTGAPSADGSIGTMIVA